MHKFDLRHFTDTSEKIPSHVLGHAKLVPKSKILSSHLLDSGAVFSISGFLVTLMEASLSLFLVTPKLHLAWSRVHHSPAMLMIMGVVAFSYFFFSHFFNQGQTWGMSVMKIRYPIESFSYQQAFKKACTSLSLYLSAGLSIASLQRDLSHHDHLYVELTQTSRSPSVNLVESIRIADEMDRELDRAA